MRTFSSYGPIDKDQHYYAPRTALLQSVLQELIGEDPSKDAHTIVLLNGL